MTSITISAQSKNNRVLSVDFLRGLTMFLLVSRFGQLFDPSSSKPIVALLGRQLEHAYWDGLTAWDLVQPVFMFIAGVSMPLSIVPKWNKGVSWKRTFYGVLQRSLILLLLGWLIGSTASRSSFTNVLAQLSVTYFISFLLMRFAIRWQLLVSLLLIIITDVIYRTFGVPGFDQPFTADHNFGSWFDIFLTGGLSEDRWVAFNAVPTAAHTIWGVATGLVLMKDWTQKKKTLVLFFAGIAGIIAGYSLGMYIPMIKRTCTSSFIFASGGWAVAILAVCYYVMDVIKLKRWVLPFAIVGMNPLFIYLFWHSGGARVMESLAEPVVYRLFAWSGQMAVNAVMVLVVAFMMWYICYFMYRRNIFIRI
ncbi:MAG: hypothetical protein JNK79_06585 [Chitinophagaceae bacterium]|nr:hypothetical protein [Chitinophagaceae bacterium]